MSHDERIHALENIQAETRLLSIEGQLEGLSDHIEKLHDMINMEDRITASDVLLRLTQLETNVGKKPHKCPVCEGKGKIRIEPKYSISRDGMIARDQRHLSPVEYNCHSCDGKGILWG